MSVKDCAGSVLSSPRVAGAARFFRQAIGLALLAPMGQAYAQNVAIDTFGNQIDSGGGTVNGGPAASPWNVAGNLWVGAAGAGDLVISAGGQVTVDDLGRVGSGVGSTGTVSVTGAGSSWMLGADGTGSLTVGASGDGTLVISDGGTVNCNAACGIGSESGATGAVTVTGAGSSLTGSDIINVGWRGEGSLTIAEGGVVSMPGFVRTEAFPEATGVVNIGARAGDGPVAPGTLSTPYIVLGPFGDGTATLVFNHTGTAYEFDAQIRGAGAVRQVAGSTVLSHGNSTYTGDTLVEGGTLLVTGAIASSAVTVGAGATLGGDGAVASVTNSGTLAPGMSPETLTINGDLLLTASSVLEFELDAPPVVGGGVNDLIEVNGDVTLNGTLNIIDWGNYGAGTYELIHYTGTLTDNGLAISTQPAGFNATYDIAGGVVYLIVTTDSALPGPGGPGLGPGAPPQPVPVFAPPMVLLLSLLLGLTGFGVLRRR